jgi:hypothetical protein
VLCAPDRARAFLSEVDAGSRQENASKQESEPRFDSIETEKALEQWFTLGGQRGARRKARQNNGLERRL